MYNRFVNEVMFANLSKCDEMRLRHTAQHVGFVGHQHRNPMMFDKWYNIPNKAHRLFWRLHPECNSNLQNNNVKKWHLD